MLSFPYLFPPVEEHLMRFRSQYLLASAAVVVVFVSVLAPAKSRGGETLCWKLEVGEKLDYNMTQEMNMSAEGGPVGQMTSSMRQEMDMIWDVIGIDKQTGEAVIKQKFDRVKMKMTTPLGSFEYDSKSDAAPTGLAAQI